MSLVYDYANTRVRAMKSYLIDRVFYERLIEMEDLNEIIAALEKTPYKKDIEEGVLRHPGVPGIEEGLRRNIIKTYSKILSLVEGEAKELVKIVLGRWDVHNIKTVLRGKHIGAPTEAVTESFIPAGELTEPFLIEMAKEKDVKGIIDLLATWGVSYAKPLTEHFSEYARTLNLANLELALDRFYYENALRSLRKESLNVSFVKEVVRREIDFVNIMTLLRLTREKVEAEEIEKFFIEGGKDITKEKFLTLAELKSPEEIVNSLKRTPYYEALKKGLEEYFKSGLVSPIQRRMEELIVRKSIALFKADPLSIALIIAYIWAKFNEVVNLRIIIRGKSVGMPEKKIREALVLV